MARRSDHTRDELRSLILSTAHRHLAERGLSGFSAARVAKEIGYSVPTLHQVIGDHVDLVSELNTMTMRVWAEAIRRALGKGGSDRIAVLVEAYFAFAQRNPNLWSAIYNLELPAGRTIPDDQANERGQLRSIISGEIAAVLPGVVGETIHDITNSLVATVHGHCDLWLHGSLELMGSVDPQRMALQRVRECLAATARP